MALPPEGIVSVPGFFFIIGEVVIGLAIGFVLQMGLAAALLAGEVISNAMGLGFASMVDPLSGASSSAIGQFLSMMATALFLAADGERKRVVMGKRVSVMVNLGGRRNIKQKKKSSR